ncbi:WD repeat-containing protein 35 [Physocladia obscura]|uniref:WD repeat-containing protein 35 n=1 Tax=Physocladia obscura TaxID=109957 RepID=A0AAD5TBW5_9FUNG|nr:WD repeat-containing protein 35 [Physocladia obscura]
MQNALTLARKNITSPRQFVNRHLWELAARPDHHSSVPIRSPISNDATLMERHMMNSIFGELASPAFSVFNAPAWSPAFVSGPALDIVETDKAYIVTADLPGLKKVFSGQLLLCIESLTFTQDEVSVKVKNGGLRISGKRTIETEDKSDVRHIVERSSGSFSRSIDLPTDASNEKISASMENGVLKLEIPKNPAGKGDEKKIKIAIPNGIKLRTVAWDNDQGWIACGGEDGLLKVLKLENPPPINTTVAAADGKKPPDPATSSNLSMNQTLEGHSGAVIVSKWNEQYKKLTTSDQFGLIIVWILYKGTWYEEMINNRNKSVVADMEWSKDGQKICIIYEDVKPFTGAVIVGSVDGNRIWGKELKQTALTHVQWYNGSNGYVEVKAPCLAIAFENGKIQIMRDDKDPSPLVLDTNMRFLNIKWNNYGSVLAVSGIQFARSSQGEEKEVSVVQFYDTFGQYLRSLKVPGKKISSLSWEHGGLRIALAVDSFIYFANIRPDYKWCHFATDILAYGFQKYDQSETMILYWNTKTNDRYVKLVNKLSLMTSDGEYCLLVSKADESVSSYLLTVANAIGTAIETRQVHFAPTMARITKTQVIVSSTDTVFCWQFRIAPKKSGALDVIRRKEGGLKDRMFHIEDVTDTLNLEIPLLSLDSIQKNSLRLTGDPITCISVSESLLMIARQSGTFLQIALQSISLEAKYTIQIRPQTISLNSNNSKLAILDVSGVLKMLKLGKRSVSGNTGSYITSNNTVDGGGNLIEFERKDVWDIKWAADNPESFAIMEKTRMFIFQENNIPEEPVTCSGYICAFENLQVKTVLLDDLLKDPESPKKDYILTFDSKQLRETRAILTNSSLQDAMDYVEENPHQRLWKLISDTALEKLDLGIAQKGFVRSLDYKGLQFLKRIEKLDDKEKQKAEIAVYFGNIEAAEKIYLEIDRKDLAIQLRTQMGDWFRVVQLIKSGGGGDDLMLENAWNSIGDYYYERQRWSQAVTYYLQGRNQERLIECYYIIEDYDNLEKIIYTLPENSPLLANIAEKFVSVGLCDQAVAAFIKAGSVKSAIDTCVQQQKWNMAVELAEVHRFQGIETLLAKYAEQLLESDKKLTAIELYRKANYCQKSAHLLYNLAEEASKEGKNPLRIKKFYVLAALEVERYHQLTKFRKGGVESEISALDGLLAEDLKGSIETKFLDNVWRGAEAYHFYILAQRQFYNGNVGGSMRTSLSFKCISQ